ncbi:MAG: DNA polymerase II large subunit [Nanoarchaeota archaeon]|nr:DNA polymerase II large subunit [Nanoarchaeota archaeon]
MEEEKDISPEIEKYFEMLDNKIQAEHQLAGQARSKNLDPTQKVEIALAKDMAERVLGLIATAAPQILDSNLVPRIKELEEKYGSLDWRVAFTIGLEIAQQKMCKFETEREAMEVGIRAGFAYVTIGTTSACLEGFTKLEIKKRRDGKEYFAMWFSGPTRNAGGTAASVSVLIGDYIRRQLGYDVYDPDEKEVKRVRCEVEQYHERCDPVQYLASEEEMDFFVKHNPIEIAGDPSERVEVPNYKNLPRVPTNIVRSGFCLIYSECLPAKAPKLWAQLSKWGKDFNMDQWNFLEKYIKIQKEVKARKAGASKKDENKSDEKITPVYTYIADLVGGRPVFGHPLQKGAFRLRFGRSRTSGLSGQSVHPATMHILNDFIATGTQFKLERPGKATVVTPCDELEGPIVKLENGNVLLIDSEEMAKQYKSKITEILFTGDLLICYGDFFDRAHILAPPGYCEEWWVQELEKAIVDTFGSLDLEKTAEHTNVKIHLLKNILEKPINTKISARDALNLSKNLSVPLHPRYTYHWKDISLEQFSKLLEYLKSASVVLEGNAEKIILSKDPEGKRVLEELGIPHITAIENVIIQKDDALAFHEQLANFDLDALQKAEGKDPLEKINNAIKLKLRDKSGIYIGSRMGRPEKAKMRKMKGSPHGLFPIGEEGGRLRSFQAALKVGQVYSSFPVYVCPKCKKTKIYATCEECNVPTVKYKHCDKCGIVEDCAHNPKEFSDRKINFGHYFQDTLNKLKTTLYPDLIKGIKGTINKEHYLEHMMKAVLRAKYDVYVNKDGTVRYDAIAVPVTHFKPKEIQVSVKRLRELRYTKDIKGKELENDNQILEIKHQDLILPCCPEIETPADNIMMQTTFFIDDLLEYLYGLPRYYNCKTRDDLVGHTAIALAPHTSAGTAVRILGFSKTQGFMGHPLLLCACRRDADGDEIGFFLALDGFLNFSKKYLPDSRGGTMDAPIVLTSNVKPAEVDDMIFKMDTAWKYPLEFYNACLEYKMPWEVKIEQVSHRLGKPEQYEGYGFTHDNGDFNSGVLISSYKTLPTMQDKLLAQMDVAERVRAVNEADVADLVINKHFIKDTKGNLRKFSQQVFRCVTCNTKYRRPPLSGRCNTLGCKNSKIIFTVSEGSVVKYLEPSLSIAEKYNVTPYLRQTLKLTKQRVESVFGKDKERQEGLGRWFK